MDRRNFLGLTSAATTGLLLSLDELLASQPKPELTMTKDSELKIFATNWGFEGSMEEYCSRVKKVGYDGIEIWWPGDKKAQDELFSCLKKTSIGCWVSLRCGAG